MDSSDEIEKIPAHLPHSESEQSDSRLVNLDAPPISWAAPTWGVGAIALGIFGSFITSAITYGGWLLISGEPVDGPVTLGKTMAGLLGAWTAFFGTCLWAVRGQWPALRTQLGARFSFPNDLWKGVGIGILGQIMVTAIYAPLQFISQKLADSVSSVAQSDTAAAHGWRWFPIVIGIAIVSPFFEELFFRGMALRALRKHLSPKWAMAACGLVFGLAHFQGIQTPALVLFGWLLAWRATKTGRIGETFLAHATFNGITLVALALS